MPAKLASRGERESRVKRAYLARNIIWGEDWGDEVPAIDFGKPEVCQLKKGMLILTMAITCIIVMLT